VSRWPVAEKAGQAGSVGHALRCRLEARDKPSKLAEEGSTGGSGARDCAAHGREDEVQERQSGAR
jgi:hypothetical protein